MTPNESLDEGHDPGVAPPAGSRPAKYVAFALVAVFVALVCVRLGFWQLSRHAEARAASADRAALLAEPPLSLDDLAGDGAVPDGRLVRVRGAWEPAGEVLIRNRTLNGRPGVQVVTPLRLAGDGGPADSAGTSSGTDSPAPVVLVLRGWLPAPDAMTPGAVAPPHELPADGAAPLGVVQASRDGSGLPELPSGEGAYRRPSFAAVDVSAIAAATGSRDLYLPAFVQLLPADGATTRFEAGQPIPVPLPAAGSGPHLSYAIQWFSFAAIALVGTAALFRRERQREREHRQGRSDRPVRGDPDRV